MAIGFTLQDEPGKRAYEAYTTEVVGDKKLNSVTLPTWGQLSDWQRKGFINVEKAMNSEWRATTAKLLDEEARLNREVAILRSERDEMANRLQEVSAVRCFDLVYRDSTVLPLVVKERDAKIAELTKQLNTALQDKERHLKRACDFHGAISVAQTNLNSVMNVHK